MGTVSVSATGRVEVTPDFATVQVSFTRKKPTEAEARQALHQAIIQLSDNLKAFNVQGTDLSFSQAGVRPIVDWNIARTAQETVGYEAFKTSNVIIRDLGALKDVANGILQVSGDLGKISDISFGMDDKSEFETKARAIAMQKANAKAEQLADGTASSLGGIRSLSESIHRPTSVMSKEVLFAHINSGHNAQNGAKLYATVSAQMVYNVRPK